MSLPIYNAVGLVYKDVVNLYKTFTPKNTKVSTLEIHAHISIINLVIPKVLGHLNNSFEYQCLKLVHTEKLKAINDVLEQKCDIAIFPFEKHEVVDSNIRMIPLFDYKPIVLFNKNSPLRQKKHNTLTFEDIGKSSQFFHAGANSVSKVQAHRIDEGILTSKIDFENCTWDTLKSFVRNGLGTMILHKGYLTEEDKKDMDYRAIDNLSPDIKYYALIKKGVNIKREIVTILQKIKELFSTN